MKTTERLWSRADRFLVHNERPCTGKHCAECTPTEYVGTHRAEEEQ